MKKIYGFAALCAALSLASCSNNDEPNVVDPTVAMDKCYISVNLSTPLDTRAPDSYKPGEGNEDDIHSVTFLLFDATEGKYIGTSGQVKNLSFSPSGIFENTASKVIEVDKIEGKAVGNIMTIINCPTDLSISTDDKVDDVRKKVGSYNTTTLDGNEYFVMTNSAYGANTYANDFTNKVYPSIGAAIGATPVDIYVERVASRIDMQKGSSFKDQATVKGENADGTEMTITVDIDGYAFIYATTNSYLVKDIDGLTDTNAFAGWNTDASTTFRTHWANSVPDNKYAYTKVYYKTTKANGKVGTVAEEKNVKEYLYENVNQNTPTYVVISGDISVGDDKNVDIYQLWQNGKYYKLDGATNQLLGYLQQELYQLEGENAEGETVKRDVTKDDVAFVASKSFIKDGKTVKNDYDGYLTITIPAGYKLKKNGVTIKDNTSGAEAVVYNFDDNTETMTVNSNTVNYKNKYRIYKWGGGKTYYYVPIAPLGQKEKPGVIRNHIYDVTFNSLTGLGTPLFDPDGELLPKTPDTPNNEGPKWYFNATINVLQWAVYKQNMDFK